MANAKPKKIKTPRGRFMYPKLNEPDYGTKEYPNEDGSYNVRLVLSASSQEAKQLIAKIKPLHEEAIELGEEAFSNMKVAARKKHGEVTINPFYEVLYDKETEEETGDIAFRFKCKASGKRKNGPKAGTRWERKLIIFDAKGKLMARPPEIWGGTEGKISFTTRPYFVEGQATAGLSLQLEAVQIISLVTAGQRDASDFGFEEEEDGYIYDPSEHQPPKDDEDEFGDETNSTDDDNDEGDF